jgi:hypothetical protein
LGPIGPKPTNEFQIRPLSGLEPEQQRTVWHQAITESNAQPTGAKVEEVAKTLKQVIQERVAARERVEAKASSVTPLSDQFTRRELAEAREAPARIIDRRTLCTLKNQLMIHAPGLTPSAVFEKLATIQIVEVWIPMLDGRWLVLPRHTQPEKDVQAVLDQLRIALPSQPPPRIKASQVAPRTASPQPSLW